MRAVIVLPADVGSVRRARRFVAAPLARTACPASVVADILLLVSELATNSLVHTACDSFTVTVDFDGRRVRVAVADGDPSLPEPRTPAPGDDHGRGLSLTASLAARWGVDRLPGPGKSVWFELPCDIPDGRHRPT